MGPPVNFVDVQQETRIGKFGVIGGSGIGLFGFRKLRGEGFGYPGNGVWGSGVGGVVWGRVGWNWVGSEVPVGSRQVGW